MNHASAAPIGKLVFSQHFRRPCRAFQALGMILCLGLALIARTDASSLIYKNYIIRYDRGWDILCEPYVVQKNDWVLKIFRQKGEIAHQDFRDFLGIFTRLNPHVKDINMIRPGQTIDIPLRKLEHGALPGQATGVVSIPFVTLSKVTRIVKEHSNSYKVRRGDTVSQLIARKYGRFGTKGYQEGIKLFQAANPDIQNLDVIYAGQTVYLPDPTIRDASWYADLYDNDGNLQPKVPQDQAPGPSAAAPTAVAPTPPGVSEQTIQDPIARAAAIVGGNFYNKGTYYLPQPQKDDFEIDLSRHPLLEMTREGKVLFAREGQIMGMGADQARTAWPEMRVVSVREDDTTEEIIASIFKETTPEQNSPQGVELGFTDRGVQVTVRAKWTRPETDNRTLCIIPIKDPGEFTSESIRRYLEQHDIVLKEMLPDGEARLGTQDQASQRHAVQNILSLAPKNQKGFIQDLASALGFSYAPNVSISYPYAGIQVEAFAHLVSAGGGREVMVDYGDLYGDALTAIAQSGLRILQFQADDDFLTMARKLLSALEMEIIDTPSFWGAQRSPEFNTAITVPGILYIKDDGEQILLSSAALHPAVTDLVSSAGIDMVVW